MADAAKRQDMRGADTQRVAHEIIDTDRYPLHERGSAAYTKVVADLQRQIEREGCAVVPNFVRPDALSAMRRESEALAPHAHYRETYTNPYNNEDDPNLPWDHPKRQFQDRSNAFVAGDLINADTCIRAVYHDPGVQAFLADVLGVEQVYEYADPLAGLVVNVLKPGCQHPWHFDTNEFIVTMMSKKPEAGGEFEYCPGIRSTEDENLQGVSETVRGDRSRVKVLDVKPGDLQIFFGRYSLHRVTRPEGETDRHTVIFGYAKEPDMIGKAERSKKLFGRTAEVHEQQAKTAPNRADTLQD